MKPNYFEHEPSQNYSNFAKQPIYETKINFEQRKFETDTMIDFVDIDPQIEINRLKKLIKWYYESYHLLDSIEKIKLNKLEKELKTLLKN